MQQQVNKVQGYVGVRCLKYFWKIMKLKVEMDKTVKRILENIGVEEIEVC